MIGLAAVQPEQVADLGAQPGVPPGTSREDWAAAATSMVNWVSARRRSLAVPAELSRAACWRRLSISSGRARSAASRAAVPETALRWSPSSRISWVPQLAQPPRQRLAGIGRRNADEGAATAAPARDHQALVPEDGEGLAQGHRRDPELLGQLGLGRQPLAVEEEAQPDGLAEAGRHVLGPAGRRRVGAQDGAGGGRRQAHGGRCLRHSDPPFDP